MAKRPTKIDHLTSYIGSFRDAPKVRRWTFVYFWRWFSSPTTKEKEDENIPPAAAKLRVVVIFSLFSSSALLGSIQNEKPPTTF